MTYIKRVYYPFMVREPELGSAGGNLCALWLHSLVGAPADPSGSVVLGLAIAMPALENLPAALAAVEDIISQSGTPFSTPRQSRAGPQSKPSFEALQSLLQSVQGFQHMPRSLLKPRGLGQGLVRIHDDS